MAELESIREGCVRVIFMCLYSLGTWRAVLYTSTRCTVLGDILASCQYDVFPIWAHSKS